MNQNFDHCVQIVHEHDKTLYLSSLYAPVEVRPHLFALYAFVHEISNVRAKISEPLPGEVRLQWWRDVVNNAHSTDANPNPIAAALCDTIQKFNLPLDVLINMINARVFDIYNDPMPTLNDLEGYAGETQGATIMLAAMILNKGKTSECAHLAGHAGCALVITHILQNLAYHTRLGQVYIPQDILEKNGLTAQDVLSYTSFSLNPLFPFPLPSGEGGTQCRVRGFLSFVMPLIRPFGAPSPEGRREILAMHSALQELMRRAIWHVDQIQCERNVMCKTLSPAFLPVCLVRKKIKKISKQPLKLLERTVDICQLSQILILHCAARRAG